MEMPGTLGGATWSGTSYDPTLGYLFVNVNEIGAVGLMKPQPANSPEAYVWTSKWGTYARFWDENHYPCQKPPWGTLNAIDLSTGDIAWRVPLGVIDELDAKGIPKTGVPSLGGSIATAGELVFIAGTGDSRFRAFDSRTGKELWVTRLEASGHATPMTFLGRKTGKQFVVIAAGGSGLFATSKRPEPDFRYAGCLRLAGQVTMTKLTNAKLVCVTLLSLSFLSAQQPAPDPLLRWMDQIAQQQLQRRKTLSRKFRARRRGAPEEVGPRNILVTPRRFTRLPGSSQSPNYRPHSK